MTAPTPPPSSAGPWVLALDVGTSSVRSALVDGTGVLLGEAPVAQIAYRWRTHPPGAMEADPDELLALVVDAADAAVARAGELGLDLVAVGTAVFWHSTMGVGADGRALTPLFGWGDARPARAAADLRQRVDATAVHRRTGCFLDPTYPAARLLWLREARSTIFARSTRWISFGEYIDLRLCGELRCSLSMASATGLLDGVDREWDAEVLDAVGIGPASLAPLVDAGEAATLDGEFAHRWPALAAVPWFPALGDGACASLGVGAAGEKRRGLTIGTTAALRSLVRADRPIWHPELWCYRLDADRVVAGRALSNGGNAIASLQRTLRLPPPEEREALLGLEPPDGHGLTILPWLVGERGVGAPHAGAAVWGITERTGPLHLLRGWMEAIGLRIGALAEVLDQVLGAPDEVLVGGGALRASRVWRTILADVLGQPITLPQTAEGAVRGAALMAMESLKLIDDAFEAPSPAGEVVLPEPRNHAIYSAAAVRQRRFAHALREFA
jgi:gluconokinase